MGRGWLAGESFYVYDGKFVEGRFSMANYGAMSPGDVRTLRPLTSNVTLDGCSWVPACLSKVCGRCLCAQVSFHAGWTIHGGMPNVGDSTREALAISWVPEQTTMLPAFDVVGKYGPLL